MGAALWSGHFLNRCPWMLSSLRALPAGQGFWHPRDQGGLHALCDTSSLTHKWYLQGVVLKHLCYGVQATGCSADNLPFCLKGIVNRGKPAGLQSPPISPIAFPPWPTLVCWLSLAEGHTRENQNPKAPGSATGLEVSYQALSHIVLCKAQTHTVTNVLDYIYIPILKLSHSKKILKRYV